MSGIMRLSSRASLIVVLGFLGVAFLGVFRFSVLHDNQNFLTFQPWMGLFPDGKVEVIKTKWASSGEFSQEWMVRFDDQAMDGLEEEIRALGMNINLNRGADDLLMRRVESFAFESGLKDMGSPSQILRLFFPRGSEFEGAFLDLVIFSDAKIAYIHFWKTDFLL